MTTEAPLGHILSRFVRKKVLPEIGLSGGMILVALFIPLAVVLVIVGSMALWGHVLQPLLSAYLVGISGLLVHFGFSAKAAGATTVITTIISGVLLAIGFIARFILKVTSYG